MSTTDAFSDVLGERISGKADRGVSASRKAQLTSYEAPYAALDELGVEIPHREFNTDAIREYPTTVALDGGGGPLRVSLHQDVRERNDDVFGDFGAADEDVEDVTWTVVDLTEETVTLTVVGEWSRRRNVEYTEFPKNYTPLYLSNGEPKWGY